MRLKGWVRSLLIYMVILDMFLVGTWLYMLRLIEIGG